jgi:serine/threonine protein kinase
MDQQSVDGGTDAVLADLTGTLLAEKYRVVRPLGRGSTGTVYLCWHAALEKHVALKVLHPELSGNPDIVTRFQREAQATARLDHAHSVRVTDFGHDQAGGFLYLAMEYVEGRDLGQVLAQDWPLSDQRVVNIMSQVLSALSAAHALGIVHRDLKPENILVRAAVGGSDEQPNDDVKVCDFGIAQLSPIRLAGPAAGPGSRLHAVTAQGRVVGTPAYMSPEQARAEAQDARSDVYSAGIVLFQLLTRTTPFVAETPLSVAVMHCVTPPPPPSGYGAVNSGLEAVCLKALSKTREARFQSAREMQLALEATIAKRSSHAPARRISAPPPAGRASRAGAVRSDTRTLSLAPAEVVVTRGPAKRQFPMLKGAAGALIILAIMGLPMLLQRKPGSHAKRSSQPLTVGSQVSLLPAASASSLQYAATAAPPYAAVSAPEPMPPSAAYGTAAHASPAHAEATAPHARTISRVATAPAKRASRRASVAALPEIAASQPAPEPASSTDALATAVADALDVPEPSESVEPASDAPAAPALPAIVTTPSQQPAAALATAAPVAPAVALRFDPPPTAAPSASHRVDPARASVSIGMPVTHHAAVSKASLRGALNQSALTRCYQDALRSGNAPAQPTDARLDLTTGMGGHVVSASLDASTLPRPLRQCIEQVARAGRLREADTGEAQASVTLRFQPD